MDAKNNNNSSNDSVAPFVCKTYQMVNDPLTDTFITWGSAGNTFLVLRPLDFSHSLLPAYFKHNNFSSFIRQLNTYGFRKVDPDRWEFANEWFLRGQFHLLRNIVRKKQSTNAQGEIGDEELLSEIARLRKEHNDLEEEIQGMKKRIETTEKRPQQMMTFLHKLVEDPQILPRMMLRKYPTPPEIGDKKRRLMVSDSSSSPSTTSLEVEETDEEIQVQPPWTEMETNGLGIPATAAAAAMDMRRSSSVGELKYLTEMMAAAEESNPAPPYPFSLFGCGF